MVFFKLLKCLLLMWVSQVNMVSELGERAVLLVLRLPAVFCSQRTAGLSCLLFCSAGIYSGGKTGVRCTGLKADYINHYFLFCERYCELSLVEALKLQNHGGKTESKMLGRQLPLEVTSCIVHCLQLYVTLQSSYLSGGYFLGRVYRAL